MLGFFNKLPAKITENLSDSKTPAYPAPVSTLRPVNNQFTKILAVTKYLPAGVRASVLTKAFGKVVPFVGTAGVYYESVTPNQVVVSLNNDKSVQNHIGSIHAVAVTLLAETATGFILGLNLPADRILLVKSYQVNFYRPLKKGQVAAVATLTDEQRQHILDTPKGEMLIPCIIDDRESDSTRDPITVEMTWAWIPKSELDARRTGKDSEAADKLAKDANDNSAISASSNLPASDSARSKSDKNPKKSD